jgi:preprotein translocase subunit SecB
MQITPSKFFVRRLAFGKPEDIGFSEISKNLDLKVEATKASDLSITIHLYLKLILESGNALDVEYAGNFDVNEPETDGFCVTDEVLKKPFIQVNAPAIAYPFLRAFVSTLCVTAGCGGVIIPPINFQAIYDRRRKEDQLSNAISLEGDAVKK